MAVSEFSTVARLPLGAAPERDPRTTTPPSPTPRSRRLQPLHHQRLQPRTAAPTGRTRSGWAAISCRGRARPRRTSSSSSPTATRTGSCADRHDRVRRSATSTSPRCRSIQHRDDERGREHCQGRAVPNANALKARARTSSRWPSATRSTTRTRSNRIIAVSGPDVFSGTGRSTSHRRRLPGARLQRTRGCHARRGVPALRALGQHPKSSSIEPRSSGRGSASRPGMDHDCERRPTPADWVLPAGGTEATATDDDRCRRLRQLPVDNHGAHQLGDHGQRGVQSGYVNDTSATTCTYRTPDSRTIGRSPASSHERRIHGHRS